MQAVVNGVCTACGSAVLEGTHLRNDLAPCSELPDDWPDECGVCGAPGTEIGFDFALGFNCRSCGAADADE